MQRSSGGNQWSNCSGMPALWPPNVVYRTPGQSVAEGSTKCQIILLPELTKSIGALVIIIIIMNKVIGSDNPVR